MKSLLILGRQPALGLAELESLFGADRLTPVRPDGVLLDIEAAGIDFARLGGSMKLARVLTALPTTAWQDIEEYLHSSIPEHLQHVPGGKLRLGLSAYGLRVRTPEINAAGIRLKKIIKSEGRSVRIVPNKAAALNSAQVLHNRLTGPTGWELVLVRHGNKTVLAQTVAEQDIEAYAARDQGRPARDARVGMLPPKLAQIIINLTDPKPGDTILDAFCGTGVVLQEALLMGFNAYGTDIEPRMIEYSRRNIDWLHGRIYKGTGSIRYDVADATKASWPHPFQKVAGETFLGKPLNKLPPKDQLEKIIAECDFIHQKFLSNIGEQIPSGTSLCLAVPAWKTKTGFLHLKTLAKLEQLGYTRKKFVHVRTEELVYHRPDQTVARELVVLERK